MKGTLQHMYSQQQVAVVQGPGGKVTPADVPPGIQLDILLAGGGVEHWLGCTGCGKPVLLSEVYEIHGDPYCAVCSKGWGNS